MNYIDLRNNTNYSKLKTAANIIKNGGLVLFPTETVYGIGANGLDKNAVKKIFIAKGRKQDNPLILHISNFDMLKLISRNINNVEQKLIDAFWPGPFTIILNRTNNVPDEVTGGLDTVGIRMPSSPIAKYIIEYSGVPIAAPSANISGKPSGTNLDDILGELEDKVDCIVNSGNCEVGIESTVVRVINNIPHILRPGMITPEQIKKVANDVVIDKHILENIDNPKQALSPGMKYKHYAPNSRCILVYSYDNQKLVDKIKDIAKNYSNPLVVCCSENIPFYDNLKIIKLGSKNNLEEISKNLFTVLRKVDTYNPDIVIIEGVKEEGIGLAIMNRLLRACSYNYIKI